MTIAKHSGYSYKFAHAVNFDLTKIPQEMIASISKNENTSYMFAIGLKFNINLMPERIIKSISHSIKLSYKLAMGLIRNKCPFERIPVEIIESLSQDENMEKSFLNSLNPNNTNNINDTLKIEYDGDMSSGAIDAYKRAVEMKFNIVNIKREDIIMIESFSYLSYLFAKGMIKNGFPPEAIPQQIAYAISVSNEYKEKYEQFLEKYRQEQQEQQKSITKIKKNVSDLTKQEQLESYYFPNNPNIGPDSDNEEVKLSDPLRLLNLNKYPLKCPPHIDNTKTFTNKGPQI